MLLARIHYAYNYINNVRMQAQYSTLCTHCFSSMHRVQLDVDILLIHVPYNIHASYDT